MKEIKPYVQGFEIWHDENGNKMPVEHVIKPISGNYFWKVKMMDFLTSLDIIGNKSVRVYSFILGHINQRTNKLKMTNKQIQAGVYHDYMSKHKDTKVNRRKASVDLSTISSAISKLEHLDIHKNHKPFLIRKRYGRYGKNSFLMINPAVLMRGREGKRTSLLIQYKEISNDKQKSSKKYTRIKKYMDKVNKKQREFDKRKRLMDKRQKKLNDEKARVMDIYNRSKTGNKNLDTGSTNKG